MLLLAGAGLLLGNPWFTAAAVLGVWLVTRLAIVREEAHLAAIFGGAWLDYARSTPRWLRLRGR
jgi:protein-S-isoprenylcysteine O-methyltransferase Ste14